MKIEIYGQQYNVRADENEDQLKELAATEFAPVPFINGNDLANAGLTPGPFRGGAVGPAGIVHQRIDVSYRRSVNRS